MNEMAAQVERWKIDPTRSHLTFSLRHIVFSEIRGRFHRWGGSLLLDRQRPGESRLDVWVDLASIDTGDAERDAHVQSAEFLDVARFPRATFRSALVGSTDQQVGPPAGGGAESHPGDGELLVHGALDLHGVRQNVDLIVVPGATSMDGPSVLRNSYAMRGTVNRQSFALHWNQDLDIGGVVVGDRVDIHADLELLRSIDGELDGDPHRK